MHSGWLYPHQLVAGARKGRNRHGASLCRESYRKWWAGFWVTHRLCILTDEGSPSAQHPFSHTIGWELQRRPKSHLSGSCELWTLPSPMPSLTSATSLGGRQTSVGGWSNTRLKYWLSSFIWLGNDLPHKGNYVCQLKLYLGAVQWTEKNKSQLANSAVF